MPTEKAILERKQFQADFPDIAGQIDASRTGMQPGVSETARIVQTRVQEARRQIKLIGPRPATVINLHFFSIQPQGPVTSHYTVPGCEIGREYAEPLIIGHPELDIKFTGGEAEDVGIVWPIEIAQDILQQNERSGREDYPRGGIVIYMGDRHPAKLGDDLKRDVMADIEKARATMERFYMKLYEEAQGEFYKTNKAGWRNIGEMHRGATRYLLHWRLIDKAPEWLAVQKIKVDPCPACGAEPKAGSYKCTCNRIIDAEAAYLDGAIDLENVQHRQSLMKLGRAKLDEIGLAEMPDWDEYQAEIKAEIVRKRKEAKKQPQQN